MTDGVLEDATRGVREATLAALFADPDAVGAIRVCAQSARLLPGFQLDPLDFAAIYMARKTQNGGQNGAEPGQA